MSERVNHCPFLNRSDDRCATHFSLDRLGSAFDHCFGSYGGCAAYQEMLAERRLRQRPDATHDAAVVSFDRTRPEPTYAARPVAIPVFVQVRLPLHAHHAPAA